MTIEPSEQNRLRIPRAVYIHVPFCVSKCYYCEFNSYPGLESIFDSYVQALIAEIEQVPMPNGSQPLDTVYFGGGTPTILPASDLSRILLALRDHIGISSDAEVTTEANPGTIDRARLSDLRHSGFNRLSIGIQSFDDEFLARIGRLHTASQALDAYGHARSVGFSNISLDLMFALPGQTLQHWDRTLSHAVGLEPEHISLYELSIEEGTRFSQLRAQGQLDLVDENTQIEMYELAIARITSAGYEHYEVSNFARSGYRSRHNMVYWRNEPYYGFGAGATSYIGGTRARRVALPSDYIAAINSGSGAIESAEHLIGRAWVGETIIQGLRMLDGVDLDAMKQRTGADIPDEFSEEITKLQARGLLEISSGHLKVTHEGLLLLNDVSQEFLS